MRLDAINFRDGSTWTSLKDLIYPVGSIFMKATDTANPGSVIGDTWAQIQGKFLLGANSSYAIKSTGGEAIHTLTVDEMPTHRHSLVETNPLYGNRAGWSYDSNAGDKLFYGRYTGERLVSNFIGDNTISTGGGRIICLIITLSRDTTELPNNGDDVEWL